MFPNCANICWIELLKNKCVNSIGNILSMENLFKTLFAWKGMEEIFGLGFAYNHAQHQCCTTCLPTPLSFQDWISLKLLYELSWTWIVGSFQWLDFVAMNQFQVAPKNLADIKQYFHVTRAIWETIGNHSKKHLELLWLAWHNVLVHNSNVGCCVELIPCLHE
jgi:hypothetical protein